MESECHPEFAQEDTLFAPVIGETVSFVDDTREYYSPPQRRAEEELRESEQKCAEILRSIEEGYYEVDTKGNLMFFNEALVKILGYSPDEMAGMNNRVYMSEETAKTVYHTFNEVHRSGKPTKAFDWELITKNGQRRYVETSVSLIQDRRGEPSGFRGIARDITERKALEKARERIINHLSHELGTPLSIIRAVLGRISKELKKEGISTLDKMIERGQRNVSRLLHLQIMIGDIMNPRLVPDTERITHLIEDAASLVEELSEEELKESETVLVRRIHDRLASLYKVEEPRPVRIVLSKFLDDLCLEAISAMGGRDIEMIRDFEEGIILEMDPCILRKACGGLLRNAIQNTPDEGKIEIKATSRDGHAIVAFHDYGIGITEQNQKMIFGGFFHTQDTGHYATRRPYFFNAGGSGSDLLRTKVFSERFGFHIDFSSTRCRHLPSDSDECPGRISSCPFAKTRDECFSSGGSTFSLLFPLKAFSAS